MSLPNNDKFYRKFTSPIGTKEINEPKYNPYESDNESDNESNITAETSSTVDTPDQANFALLGYNLNKAAGETLNTPKEQLKFGINQLNRDVGYSAVDEAFNITLPFNTSNETVEAAKTVWKTTAATQPKTQTVTSIVMFNSRDRDTNVYPTPCNLVLRLPRIYRNIISMQILQMKLLSSFLYFSLVKSNTSIMINELNRINYNYLGNSLGSLNILKYIRDGTYNINTLIAELTIQLNTPPLFYDFVGGFNQFVSLFVSTGDFSINFNYPGDYFYDSLNQQYIAAPTMSIITLTFWSTTTLGFTPNLNQTKVAYYYPILREYLINPLYGIDKLNTNIDTTLLLTGETIYSRIVYTFQGVNDIIVQSMINLNITALDVYRSAYTFRQGLINKYVIGYNTYNNNVYIQSPSLNTSLVNLLTAQYNIYLSQQLSLVQTTSGIGITTSQYTALQTLNNSILSVVNDMYNYIQTQLALYFGINFNTFAQVYFTQPNNYIYIQNAINAIGISSNYDINVIQSSNNAITTNIIEQNRVSPKIFWPLMSNQSETVGYPFNLGASNIAPYQGGSNYGYDITNCNFDFTAPFIDSDGDVSIDLSKKVANIICPIDAGKYTVFRFRSLYRQTLEVETLPRPTQYRYPLYNSVNYDSNIVSFFDNSYCFVYNSNNYNMDNVAFSNLQTIYGFSNFTSKTTANFGINLASSSNLWGTSNISMNVRFNAYNFAFSLPMPPSFTNGIQYTQQVALTLKNYSIPSSNLPTNTLLFLYHDRAAFMADIGSNQRNENPLHYKEVVTFATSDISGTFTWTAYAGQTYYAVVRSQSISFTSFNFQLLLWYPNGTTYTTLTNTLVGFDPFANPTTKLTNFNYAQDADPNFIRLPISSNLWQSNAIYGNTLNQSLNISNVAIGYDTNGVSTDLTDYVGFIANQITSNTLPTAVIRTDPISGYFFQAQSAYNQTAQSYFYTGASNFLLTHLNQSAYTATTVAFRQYKAVHWYDTTYIPDPDNITTTYNTATDITPNINQYNLASTSDKPIHNYNYSVANSNIQLGLGVCGFSFAPSDGLWNINKIMFHSAFIKNDLNSNISFLGVFLTSQINTIPTFRISMTNAFSKLNLSQTICYENPASVTFGFDGVLGTYYQFITDTSFQQTSMAGFSQNQGVFFNSANDFYSVIPFDINSNIVPMRALTGSLVPYPYVCDASASLVYFDGESSPNGYGIVVPTVPNYTTYPNNGPPSGGDYRLSAYEQSMPIGTQIVHYLGQTALSSNTSAFKSVNSIGYSPTMIFADVSGVLMIQSTDFKFYSYPYNTTSIDLTYIFSLTVDDIYPGNEQTSFVAASGNSKTYAFLGFKLVDSKYQIRIKVFDVDQDILYDINVPTKFLINDLNFSVRKFSLNDTNGFVISGTSGLGVATVYRIPSLSATSLIIDTFPGFDSVISVQSPSSSNVYSLPIYLSGLSSSNFYSVNQNYDSTSNYTYNCLSLYFNNITATVIPQQGDQVLFLSPLSSSNFYTMTNFTLNALQTYTATITKSIFSFSNSIGNPNSAISLIGGSLGSKWAICGQTPYIWGNRNDQEDAPILIQNAWQIFYPTIKLVLQKLGNSVDPIKDLSGLEYPEWPHTNMFVYNTKAAYIRDISNNKWGMETSGGLLPSNAYNYNSNGYLTDNTIFSGYYFNSYIFNVPLLSNTSTEPYYYLAVRNYTPSEKSQVLLRFNMSQRYDFGYVRIRDISNETLLIGTNSSSFNPSYLNALSNFNSNFTFSNRNFGYNPSQNISGSNITATGFGDFIRQYTSYYRQYSNNANIINTVTSNVNSNIEGFIGSNLKYIIPSNAQSRENYTDAITFSILFKTNLEKPYTTAFDEWGLGWNLGFPKLDTPYATIQRAPSFFKIIDDYIYLKMNQEYDMNRMDFGAKENLSQTLESQGATNGYNGKLLLNTFGNYAQTYIQNSVYFNPSLLRLDKLIFQWYNVNGVLITNTQCEWNAAIQIVEEVPLVADIRAGNVLVVPR